ncbi:uncharacterized protein LOC121636982 [Melanotaenia boesemani]|uniref:uncharacterized protein LOC121636982 n=1 Tax=Melanotaenia boesemani TaxID=1250792 RepID=UPI001C0597D0|nr:uncharacterized protein LOC121636982 [Melanotaenia boesemani]
MVGLMDAEVIQRISREEWRLHCRQRTHGAEETALLIQDLLDTFGGPAGRDTLDVPLLDDLRIQNIWSMQRRHLSCIQDPPGLRLYTKTGRQTKGGVSLPVYCCARVSTSLESFHLHWSIPDERLVTPLHSYSGHFKHALNLKSQRVLGLQMLIGVGYLYQQTGCMLEDVSLDPDTPDEAAAVTALEEVDEGIEEDVEDPTIFGPATLSTRAAARSGDPADAPRSEPSSPAAPT